MDTASQSFGRRLRLGRERQGISLDAIADSTKINRSLLADLERGDLSKWPPGIYRRAFVREYAGAIGLEADAVVAESLELFPEEGSPAGALSSAAKQSGELRLTLAEDPNEASLGALRRVLIAVAELSAVVALAWLLASLTEWSFWKVCSAIALSYYSVTAACSTRVPALRWAADRSLASASQQRDDMPTGSELIQLVLRKNAVRGADERTA
jgi:transcriptional regulator with XRE-family HTH domain